MARSEKRNAPKGKTETAPMPPDSQPKAAEAMDNNFENWRRFRGITTQKELSDITKAFDPAGRGLLRITICRLETGTLRYNQDHLDMLSKALRVAPRDLIGTNPLNAGDIFAVYAGFTDAEKRRALKLLDAVKRPRRK